MQNEGHNIAENQTKYYPGKDFQDDTETSTH